MSFIIKAIILLVFFFILQWWLKRLLRRLVQGSNTPIFGQQRTVRSKMVRCASCGMFVTGDSAVNLSSKGAELAFCSNRCLASYTQRVS